MWTTLLLLGALAMDGSTQSDVRAASAARLEQALVATRKAPAAEAVAALTEAGERELTPLAGSRAAARLSVLLEAELARDELRRELARLAADLAFAPRMEAPLPVGFPLPTAAGEIELKQYPTYRLARTDMGMTRRNGAFWTLFRHISSRDIAMTTPVEMTYDSDGRALREQSMAFLYANTELGSAGTLDDVEVLDVPAMSVVSLGWRGRPSRGEVTAAHAELRAWIAAREDLEVAGAPRLLSYNGPSTPTSRACSEVQIPVRVVTEDERAAD